MTTLFPERQAALRVLFKAAGQLLDNAAEDSTCSELCRIRAYECVELAEQIANMKTIKITVSEVAHDNAVLEVDNIPFSLGFTTRVKEYPDDYREDVLHAITCRLVETLSVETEDAALAAEDIAANVPEIAAWLPPDPDFEVKDEA